MAAVEQEDEPVQGESPLAIEGDSPQVEDDGGKKPLPETLGDVAKFSYLATFTTTIGLLYPEEWHQKWRQDCITQLREHLKLENDIVHVMEQVIDGNKGDKDQETFVKKLLEDPSLTEPELIPEDLMSLSLKSGSYDARTRVIAYHLSGLLGVDVEKIVKFELSFVERFIQAQAKMTKEEEEEQKKREPMGTFRRYFAIGAATLAGGALIGLTGGLAAPLMASASVTLFGHGVAFLATNAGVMAMASVFGFAGAGLSGYKVNKNISSVEEFEFEALTEDKDLHVTICVSGWLTKERTDNFYMPWIALDNSQETYSLKWESKYLKELGKCMEHILNKVMTIAAKEALKYTVLAGLDASLALPGTAFQSLTAIDKPWDSAQRGAAEAGKHLAEVLLMRQQGKRPTTLIGFSMGARVVYSCLKELASRPDSEGIIQDVCLLGTPVIFDKKTWQLFPKVVAGKIYNGYCRGDWLLQFVHRSFSVEVTDIVGLEAVPLKHSRMVNVDLTDMVKDHLDYSDKMDTILKHIGFKQRDRKDHPYLTKLAKMKADREEDKPQSPGKEKTPFIDTKDLYLTPSKKKMDDAAGIWSSGRTKSLSLNLTKNTTRVDDVRSQSMGAMTGSEEATDEAKANLDLNDSEIKPLMSSQEMEKAGMSEIGGEGQKEDGDTVPNPNNELSDKVHSIEI